MAVDTDDLISIVEGYAQGHFLMSEDENDPLAWYYTHKRTLIPLDHRFRYPKSLQRILNQNRFTVKINSAFNEVVKGCADRPSTWISQELKKIYRQLHEAGWAHSFETWQGEQLAGGILGIAIHRLFIGESMFFRIPDGSKVAMVKLVEHLRRHQFQVFDAQLMNPHLARFGAFEVTDREYQQLLKSALNSHAVMDFDNYQF